jgi:hypothetical protein
MSSSKTATPCGGDSRQTRAGMVAVPWRKLPAALDGIRTDGQVTTPS